MRVLQTKAARYQKRRHHAFMHTIVHAQHKYRNYPNVVGISGGTKFVASAATEDHHSIHFYVQRKTDSGATAGRPLPRFLYSRRADGSVDRRHRFRTDVILVGQPELACGAGAVVKHMGDRGVATLIFKNKHPAGDGRFYLMTCAHVAGSFTESPPFDLHLDGPACCAQSPFADTVANSTHTKFALPYDVALARIADGCTPQADLEVEDGGLITGVLPRAQIKPGLELRCKLPVSLNSSTKVRSYIGVVTVAFAGGTYAIDNAYLIQTSVDKGDSGGLLYVDDLGVGMVFARSDQGWGWFHPLEDALAFIVAKAAIPVEPFAGKES